jgi:hypothetical protein
MSYDQASLENALRAVEAGMFVRNAAKLFDVPGLTIGAWFEYKSWQTTSVTCCCRRKICK